MNEIKNLNIKLSVNNSLPNLKNFIKNGEMDFSIENMLKVKDLVAKKNLSRKKATKFTPLIIKLSDNINYTNKSILNLLNKQVLVIMFIHLLINHINKLIKIYIIYI